MCLAVPGKIVRWIERDSPFSRAEVEFDGICRECQMACVPDAEIGEYVIVHAGVAISQVDALAAEKLLRELSTLLLLEETPEDTRAEIDRERT